MSLKSVLKSTYPWIKSPLLVSAPMLNITLPRLAVSVSSAGGLGFLTAGSNVLNPNLERNLEETTRLVKESNTPSQKAYAERGILPIGVGFINWGADITLSIAAIKKYPPCAVWLFAPKSLPHDLVPWAERVRDATSNQTKIWVQVGSVGEAVAAAEVVRPDVLVLQGSDAGGHGLARSASVLTLVPEVRDALRDRQMSHIPVLAAGGITDGRGMAASLALGASGAVMGTRFLGCAEATVPHGYRKEILRVFDGGVSTVRTTVYDRVKGIKDWPAPYDGRGVINQSYIDASERGMSDEVNRMLYQEEMKKGDSGWGPNGRMTTYAGTGVGLVRETLPAAVIVDRTLLEAEDIIKRLAEDR